MLEGSQLLGMSEISCQAINWDMSLKSKWQMYPCEKSSFGRRFLAYHYRFLKLVMAWLAMARLSVDYLATITDLYIF